MVRRREAAALVGAAVLCAAVANLIASPQRRLAWIGSYPEALKVPAPVAPAPTPAVTAASAAEASAVGTGTPGEYPPHPDRPWVAITGDEAVALHRQGIPFLDARRTTVYEAGHIAGARSFPIWESTVEDAVKKLFEEGYDVNAPLVVYCSGGDCEDSHMLSQKLHGYGFNNALVYTDGFPDWEKRGLPVEKGAPR
jgi:rhodanese-related sulfurtransferase